MTRSLLTVPCRPVVGCLLLLGIAFVHGAQNLEAAGPAQIESFAAPDGETYFALGLKAPDVPLDKVAHDHVVLVDTTASQVGEHRLQALRVVKALLTALPADDRVSLVAIDSQFQELPSGFVSPQRSEATAAHKELRKRVQLGATDLGEGLRE